MMHFTPASLIVLSTLLLLPMPPSAPAQHDPHEDAGAAGHDGHDDHDAAPPPGPHGGRLLSDGPRQVEVTIFETGVAPQWRVWLYESGRPVDPAGARVSITVQRLARTPQTFTFEPRADFLLGREVVEEPHSFDVEVEATWGSRTLRARYPSYEARVEMSPEVAAAGGVTTEVAGPRDLERSLHLTGRIGIPAENLAELRPRFAGVVRAASATIGDRVSRGAILAELENNTTLARFVVVSPFDGVVLERRAVVGTSVNDSEILYTVADLSQVWADLDVYGADTAVVHVGEQVTIRDEMHDASADARIAYVSPLRDVHTQTTLARAVLANADRRWSPGAFVSATLRLDEPEAAVAVHPSALQTWRGHEVVFVHAGGIFEPRPVMVGRRGEAWVELLSGVDAGTTVATGNSFLLRAEIEKAGAAHDH